MFINKTFIYKMIDKTLINNNLYHDYTIDSNKWKILIKKHNKLKIFTHIIFFIKKYLILISSNINNLKYTYDK